MRWTRAALDAGREAVAQIVGRDTAELDEAGVARAAIESLAENFSDGVVAPAFWMRHRGTSGCGVYKAINTADSMIGHRTRAPPGFRLGGGAARRSRQPAGLAAVGAADRRRGRHRAKMLRPPAAWAAVWRDAPAAPLAQCRLAGSRHGRARSASRLAGPRVYGGVLVDDAWMGDGRREAGAADIRAALDALPRAPMRPADRHRWRSRRAHRASVSSRSRSICAARCAASASSVASTSAS